MPIPHRSEHTSYHRLKFVQGGFFRQDRRSRGDVAGVNQCFSLTSLKLARQVEHWALLAYRGVKSRAGHHRHQLGSFFAVCRGAALYRLAPLTTKSASRSRPLMLTSAPSMTQAHLAVGLTRLDHRLGTREAHARPWKRTRLCSSVAIGRLLVPSQRSGDPADP